MLLKIVNGKVELRKDNGLLVRPICLKGAVNAKFSGQDIALELENGKIELRKENGLLIRRI